MLRYTRFWWYRSIPWCCQHCPQRGTHRARRRRRWRLGHGYDWSNCHTTFQAVMWIEFSYLCFILMDDTALHECTSMIVFFTDRKNVELRGRFLSLRCNIVSSARDIFEFTYRSRCFLQYNSSSRWHFWSSQFSSRDRPTFSDVSYASHFVLVFLLIFSHCNFMQ